MVMEFSSIEEAFPQLGSVKAPRVPPPRRNNGRYVGNVDAPGCVAVEATVGGMTRALMASGSRPEMAYQLASVTGFRPGNSGGVIKGEVDPMMQAIFIPPQPKHPLRAQPFNLV